MVELVRKEDFYRKMGLSMKDVDKIISDVYGVIKLVAKTQGVEVPKKFLPEEFLNLDYLLESCIKSLRFKH